MEVVGWVFFLQKSGLLPTLNELARYLYMVPEQVLSPEEAWALVAHDKIYRSHLKAKCSYVREWESAAGVYWVSRNLVQI